MKKQHLVYASVVVVVVAAVLVMAMRRGPNNENFPEGTDWLCLDPTCNTHFRLTMKELGEHYKQHYGKRPLCPKCGKEAVRAEVCGHCGKVYPQARGVQICPYCRKEQVAKPA
jgi:hypothetical protein